MNKCKVSIVIPVYNAEAYLAECLESVLSQELKDVEVICVDDGSIDSSPAILARFSAQDERVRILRVPNGGVGRARNAGLETAEGEYMFFLDSDDILLPDALARLCAIADRDATDLLLCNAVAFTDSNDEVVLGHTDWEQRALQRCGCPGVCTGPELMKKIIPQSFYWQLSMQLTRLSFLREQGIRFPDASMAEDLLFWTHCLLYAQRTQLVEVDSIRRRIREDSITGGSIPYRYIRDHLQVYLRMQELGHEYPGELPIEFQWILAKLMDSTVFYFNRAKPEEQNLIQELPKEERILFERLIIPRIVANRSSVSVENMLIERNRLFHEKEKEAADKLRFAAERDRFFEERNRALTERDALWHQKEELAARERQLSGELEERQKEAHAVLLALQQVLAERDALRLEKEEALQKLSAAVTSTE